jgi:hypothetical protein
VSPAHSSPRPPSLRRGMIVPNHCINDDQLLGDARFTLSDMTLGPERADLLALRLLAGWSPPQLIVTPPRQVRSCPVLPPRASSADVRTAAPPRNG